MKDANVAWAATAGDGGDGPLAMADKAVLM